MAMFMMIILSVLQSRFGFDNYLVPEQPRWSFSTIMDDAFHYIASQSLLDTYHQFAGCSSYSVPIADVPPCPLDRAACVSTTTGNWDCETSAFVTVVQVPLQQEGQCINYNYTDGYNSEESLLPTTVYNPAVVKLFFTLPGHADPVTSQTVVRSNIIEAGPTNLPQRSTLDIQRDEYARVCSIIAIGVVLFSFVVLIGVFAWRFLKPRSKPETPSELRCKRGVDPNTSLSNVYMLKLRKINALSHSRRRELRKSRVASTFWTIHARRLKKLHTNAIADNRKLRQKFNRLNGKHASDSKELDSMKQQMNQPKDQAQQLKKQNALLDHDCAELNVKLASTETSLECAEYERADFEQKFEASEKKAAGLKAELEVATESAKALGKKNDWLDKQLQLHETCHTDVEFQELRNSHVDCTSKADHHALQDAHKACLTVFEVQDLRDQVRTMEQRLIDGKATHKKALLEVEYDCDKLRVRDEEFQQRLIKLQNTNGSDIMKLKAETDRANELEKVNQQLRDRLESQKQQHAQEISQIHSIQAQHLQESEEGTNELKGIWEEERDVLKEALEELKVEYNDLLKQALQVVTQRDVPLEEVTNLKANASESTSDVFSEVEEQDNVAVTEATDSTTSDPEPVLHVFSEPKEQHDAAYSEVEDLKAKHTQPALDHLDKADAQQDTASTNAVDLRTTNPDLEDKISRAPKAPKADILPKVPTQPKAFHATFKSSAAKKRPTRRGGLPATLARRAQAAAAAAATPPTTFPAGPSNLMVNFLQSGSSSLPFNPTGAIAATTQLSPGAPSFVPSPTNQVLKAVGSTSSIKGGLNASKWAN